jgi:hypothetical protein
MEEIRWAAVKVFVNQEGEIAIQQPWPCEDDALITFPTHQAESICKAIMKLVDQEG